MKALRLGVRRDECLVTSLRAWNIFLQNEGLRLSFPTEDIDIECSSNKWIIDESVAGTIYEPTLKLISWMHQRWFASRSSVLGLFFNWVGSQDIKLFKKIKKSSNIGSLDPQTLVVFPDLWTLYNFEIKETFPPDLILGGWQTKSAAKKAFEKISIGEAKIVFATHSWVFQNWANLKKIVVLRPHMRYYKNQQQPRYRLPEVVEKMAQIRGADINQIGDLRIY